MQGPTDPERLAAAGLNAFGEPLEHVEAAQAAGRANAEHLAALRAEVPPIPLDEGDEALGDAPLDAPALRAVEAARGDAADNAPPDDDDLDGPVELAPLKLDDEDHRRLLEVNGFAAIRGSILGAVQTIEGTPPDAIEAAQAYAERTARTLRASADPRAGQAARVAEREVIALKAARRLKGHLDREAERLRVRESLRLR